MRPHRALAALALTLALTGCTAVPVPVIDTPPPVPAVAPLAALPPEGTGMGHTVILAADSLATLPVKGRAPMTGYDRDRFGSGWGDVDGDGCDTRQAVLARDAIASTLDAGMCVDGVTITDPYSGDPVTGRSNIDIDHVVALGNAWATGAQQLDDATREALANDALNLIATSDRLNRQKGDGDAATWLPPRRAYWCDYVARQIAVKVRYGLWVTGPEGARMAEILDTCPGQTLPDNEQERPT